MNYILLERLIQEVELREIEQEEAAEHEEAGYILENNPYQYEDWK